MDEVEKLLARLDWQEGIRLRRGAKAAAAVERKSFRIFNEKINELNEKLLQLLEDGRTLPEDCVDFDELLLATVFAAMQVSIEIRPTTARLASSKTKPAKLPRIPSTPAELREWHDAARQALKKGALPHGLGKLATRIKRAYLDAVAKLYKQHDADFRKGRSWNQEYSRHQIQEATRVPRARAKTIVATETTRYYNAVRREFYDQAEGVTHYLYLAIRDSRTTDWCKPKVGRHGLIYKKGSPQLEKETPPCFLAITPVMTIQGWKSIGTVKRGDYVFTACGKWRQVTDVHRSIQKNCRIFQIGCGLATANHPYLTRTGEYVWAEEFRQEEGVCAVSFDLPGMWQDRMVAVEQMEGQVSLQQQMSCEDCRPFSFGFCVQLMEGWIQENQAWIHWNTRSRTSESQSSGIRSVSSMVDGKKDRQVFDRKRGNTPYRPEQMQQLYRESAIDVDFRTREPTSQIRWFDTTEIEVVNLEVEIDHTYCAGGFFVHNCHWNCRSEITPLSPDNPNHAKLISDKKQWRENNSPKPLPKDWNK